MKPAKFGKYYLLERINVGGMAEVFKAKSFGVEGFEKLVAIKRILPNIAEDEDFITMFIDEAKIAVLLNHANIAQIFDLGKIDDSYFIALEYVSGKDLRTIWERHKKRNLVLPIPLSAYVVSRVCEGLDYAHRKKDASGRDLNIVHRDVSPQNILVAYEGEIKIIDFGIAKAANKASKTQAGILKGKFGYMSPEQVRGLPLDRRSDVFSAGIILYEILTGERLFVADSDFSTLEKVRNVDILPPSTYNRNIPEALEKIVLKALLKDPDDRYQSAYEMQEELQRFLVLNKTNFSRKDLAAYMKRAFKNDIEREMARQATFQKMKIDGETPAGGPGKPAPEQVTAASNLQRRKSLSAAPPTEPAIPATSSSDLELQIFEPPIPPPLPSLANNDDDEIETMVFDVRTGLSAEVQQALAAAVPGFRPPSSQPSSKTPLPESPPAPPPKPELTPPEEPRTDTQPTAKLISDPPTARIPELLELDSSPEAESTVSEASARANKRGAIRFTIVLLSIIALAVVGLAVFRFLQRQGLLGQSAALTIQTTPGDAEVFLDGTRAGNRSPVVLNNVSGGSHVIETQKESYETYRETIELAGDENRTVNITMVFVPAVVELTLEPDNARVSIDGRPFSEKSPFEATVVPGVEHTFLFERAGFESKTLRWTFKPRERRKEKVVLAELFFDLELESTPSGAKAFLDGSQKGTTPTVVRKLPASRLYQLVLKHPRFPDWSSTIRYDGSPVLKVTKHLEPGTPGTVSPPERTQGRDGGAPEPPATKAVESKAVESKAVERKVSEPSAIKAASAGGEASAKPAVNAGTGKLKFNSIPWGNVWIDGKDIKKTTPLMNFELPAGKHTVTVYFSDGRSESVVVIIPAGETVSKVIRQQ